MSWSIAPLGLLSLGALGAGCGTSEPADERPVRAIEEPPSEFDPLAPRADGAGPAAAPVEEPPRELSYRELDRRGDEHLKAGRFDEAIADFDAAIALEPGLEPHHWRRGIAQYYAGEFADGVRQFELHRTVNGNDVENSAWHFLCLARLESPEAARAALLPVEPDSRVPMMTVLEMFAGRATPADVEERARAASGSAQSESALFYANLYIGLYHEVLGDEASARRYIELAATKTTSPYYMGDVARVHVTLFDD